MKTDIDHARAAERHCDLVASIVADMNRKLAKAKQPPIEAADLVFSYQWAVSLGQGARLDSCHVSLMGALGRKASFVALTGDRRTPVPRADLPPEIVALHAPRPPIDTATYPHVAAFTLLTAKGPVRALATSGYRSGRGTFIHHVPLDAATDAEGRVFEILLEIDGCRAIWSGGLVRAARSRFDATAEGDIFRYRNAPLTRMQAAEIASLIEGRTLELEI